MVGHPLPIDEKSLNFSVTLPPDLALLAVRLGGGKRRRSRKEDAVHARSAILAMLAEKKATG